MNRLGLARRIKSLNVTRNKYLRNIKEAEELISKEQRLIDESTDRLNEVEAELSKISDSTELNVSEHALLRYLERIQNVDFESIAEKICQLPESDMIIRGRTVVTIWPDRNDHKEYTSPTVEEGVI